MDFEDDAESHVAAAADPALALDLIELLSSALVAAASPSSINYRGDSTAYRRNHRQLSRILAALGIKQPFPWPNLEEGVAAAKSQFRGEGAYARRTEFFRKRADQAIQLLHKRIADQESGDVMASVTELRTDAHQALDDTSAIRAELARIETTLPDDPSSAISRAKNLIEATAKAVLRETGQPYKETDKVSKLAMETMKALGVDRETLAEHDEHIAAVMQRLHSLVHAISDLRNRVGDGHGLATAPAGLDLRHGRLAVRAAVAWSAFMLDTLHDAAT